MKKLVVIILLLDASAAYGVSRAKKSNLAYHLNLLKHFVGGKKDQCIGFLKQDRDYKKGVIKMWWRERGTRLAQRLKLKWEKYNDQRAQWAELDRKRLEALCASGLLKRAEQALKERSPLPGLDKEGLDKLEKFCCQTRG